MASARASSSGSSSDDYLPDSPKKPFFRRISKSKTFIPRFSRYQDKVPIVFFKPQGFRTKLIRNNSESNSIELEDTRQGSPRLLRKNSCNCLVCGGSKLSQTVQMLLLPKRTSVKPERKLTTVEALAGMIKESRKHTGFHLAGMKDLRLSVLIRPAPNTLYVPPPRANALQKFLTASTSASQLSPRVVTLPSIKKKSVFERLSPTVPKLQTLRALQLSPATSASEGVGTISTSSRLTERKRREARKFGAKKLKILQKEDLLSAKIRYLGY